MPQVLTQAFSSERFKLWLSTVLGAQIAVWIGYFAAWGSIPFLGNEVVSSTVAAFIASVVASALGSLLVIFLARVDRILAYLAELAEAEKAKTGISPVKQVLLTDQEAADAQTSTLVVGPSDVKR